MVEGGRASRCAELQPTLRGKKPLSGVSAELDQAPPGRLRFPRVLTKGLRQLRQASLQQRPRLGILVLRYQARRQVAFSGGTLPSRTSSAPQVESLAEERFGFPGTFLVHQEEPQVRQCRRK